MARSGRRPSGLPNTHGIADDVLFLGKQNDMNEVLSVVDILLLPSELESFGLVALEAMACEVPVVATRVGGIPEVVRDGTDGFLYDVGDVSSMAEGCLTNPGRSSASSEHGSKLPVTARSASSARARSFCSTKISIAATIEEASKHR